jgi:hypothetical protein
MKTIDFGVQLHALGDEPLTGKNDETGEDIPITLKHVSVVALTKPMPGESPNQAYKRYRFAKMIETAAKPLEFNDQDANIILTSIHAAYQPAILGAAWDALTKPVESNLNLVK